ncbi:MAG: hypothetical protein Q8Q10_02905 [bacterium]|nr:hypothetical protein [bacterium]
MSFPVSPHNLKQAFASVRLHIILFIFFLLSLPFSIRKVLAVFSPDGSFNEYLDISLYLSDILLVATLVVYILENRNVILSISYWRKMFHVEHLLLLIFTPALFILWSGLSIFWSESVPLAMVAFFRLVEGYLLYLYILILNVPRGTLYDSVEKCSTWNNFPSANAKMFHVEHLNNNVQNVPRGTFIGKLLGYFSQCSTWNILQITLTMVIISGFFQSIVAILQFISQKSLGLTTLGESIFNTYDLGIAKIVINGDVFIRSYGFFPHPNILGGFLALSLLITMIYPLIFRLKMFHVEHIIDIWLYRGLIFTQLLALSLSFSKSAIIAFIIGLVILVFGIRKMFHVEHLNDNTQNVPRGTFIGKLLGYFSQCSTWNIYSKSVTSMFNKMFHVEHLLIIWGIITVGMIVFFVNLKFFIIQPFVERLFYISSIKGLFKAYYFEGLGIGQYVFDMQHFFTEKLLLWQLQPIHNVFLLIFSETGLVGLGLFLWFLVVVFLRNSKNVPRGTNIQLLVPKCSTWNNSPSINAKMFHVEHCLSASLTGYVERDKVAITSYLFRSLLVGIILIMFFDHYFWDIQQGQLLLWIILGLASSKKWY